MTGKFPFARRLLVVTLVFAAIFGAVGIYNQVTARKLLYSKSPEEIRDRLEASFRSGNWSEIEPMIEDEEYEEYDNELKRTPGGGADNSCGWGHSPDPVAAWKSWVNHYKGHALIVRKYGDSTAIDPADSNCSDIEFCLQSSSRGWTIFSVCKGD